MYADKFHSKIEPPVFNSHKFYTEYIARFGVDAEKSFASLTEEFSKPDLEPLMSKYGHDLRD